MESSPSIYGNSGNYFFGGNQCLVGTYVIAVELLHDGGAGLEHRLPLPEPHGATHHALIVFRHLNNNRMRGAGVHFHRVSPLLFEHVPGKLDYGALEA